MIVIGAAAAAVGVLTGLLGFDGGALLFPILLRFGFELKEAVAILLFLNTIPNTAPALWAYARAGQLPWKPALLTAAATTAGIWIGSQIGLSDRFSEDQLVRAYTAVLVAAAALLLTLRV